MDDILLKIQSTVQRYTDVVSNILGIDVEVMSKNMIRVAGTGLFRSRVGEKMDNDSYVYSQVILNKEKIVIQNPGTSPICKNCPQYNNCPETFEISMPIIANKEAIGVIGLLGTTNEQRDIIVKNLHAYLDFIEHIAYFIGLQVTERLQSDRFHEINKLLYRITDSIDQGILILNTSKKLVYANNSAKEQLSLKDSLPKSFKIENNDIKAENYFEYSCYVEDRKYTLVGEEFVNRNIDELNHIIMFNEKSMVKQKINALSKMMFSLNRDLILGASKNIIDIKSKIERLADVSSTILIVGESGVGKEVVAKALWERSNRKNKRFVAINCATIPEALMESELFGYAKGSFTGANSSGQMGKFEYADKGTLFLDEMGDLPLFLQAKLLRVLQEKKITRVGSNTEISVDVRVIAATNKNLKDMVENGTFRKDLYYRLNVIPIEIEPLRRRRVDIEILTRYFLEKYSKNFDKQLPEIDESVMGILKSYSWPGNVRELQNVVEYMVAMSENELLINIQHLPKYIASIENIPKTTSGVIPLNELEKREISKALDLYGNSTESKKKIAEELGIGLSTLYRKMAQYKLS
ncbi:sigma-54-dependent Fis family transcriptional regulator [Clostridium sediminicola]|uniref:sigma-54 interaction domain-containing protein n=1 Tax=Clostridium sediminicola TaxID=3114879 RepID=UPI0031F2667D